jgi:1-acyl-sn-glycerol-3-phosphate acyltransferase
MEVIASLDIETGNRTMRNDFHPPRAHPLCLRMMRLLLPCIARLWRGVVSIAVSSEDISRLRALGSGPLLLCPNHPTMGDALVIFELGRRAGFTFNYMAARELFFFPLGWVLQRLGAYSVHRGGADREALRETRRLLTEEGRQVVIFPEGLTHEHNDRLLPLHGGTVQIGFRALAELEKRGRPARLPIVPVAIKYRFVGDAETAIRKSLVGLERATGGKPRKGADLYERLRAVGERVLDQMEREFCLCPAGETPLEERIVAAKAHVVERVAAALDVRLPSGASVSEQLHSLDSALAAFCDESSAGTSEAERRQGQRRRAMAIPLARDLRRLHSFIAVSDGYVASAMTAERFLEVLGRLEVEVFGRSRRRGRYQVTVRVGDPLELGDHLESYRQSRRGAAAEATAELARRMQDLLHPLSDLGTPVMAGGAETRRKESVGGDDRDAVGGAGGGRRPYSGHSRRPAVEQEPA